MSAIRRRLAPHWEPLEDRRCPSYAVAHVGSNLIVTGGGDDALIVEPDGAGNVTLESTQLVDAASGSPATRITAIGVDRVLVRGANAADLIDVRPTAPVLQPLTIDIVTFGGDDVVTLNFSSGVRAALHVTVRTGAGDDSLTTYFGPIDTPALTYQANLGAGDDTYDGLFFGAIAPGTSFSIFNVRGWTGDDDLQLIGVAADVGANSRLVARLSGDAGSDGIGIDFEGRTEGKLKLFASGGAGADRIDVSQSAAAGSTGSIDVNVQGQGGDDELIELLTSVDGATIQGLIDGGTGRDAYAVFGNVFKRNVETRLY